MTGRAFTFSAIALLLAMSAPADAQQVTGTPGSPSATTTIPGDQLPAPPQTFGGKIEREATRSAPYWPMRIVPPKDAPGTMAFDNYSGVGQGGTGVLKVDGNAVATQKMEHTLPFIMQWDESLDVGSDTGTPVNDADYKIPFIFTGKLEKITLTIDRPKLSPADIKKLRATTETASDKR